MTRKDDAATTIQSQVRRAEAKKEVEGRRSRPNSANSERPQSAGSNRPQSAGSNRPQSARSNRSAKS
eukprot:gene484-11840_t